MARRGVPAAGAIAAHLDEVSIFVTANRFSKLPENAATTAAHGLFRPATHQRHRTGLDLWPDRHRLYHGLRHRWHDQFRPWRYLHDRRLYRADHLPDPGFDRPDIRSRDPADRIAGIDGDHGTLWLD